MFAKLPNTSTSLDFVNTNEKLCLICIETNSSILNSQGFVSTIPMSNPLLVSAVPKKTI